MDNIVGILFIFGAAIVVGGIIVVDLVRKKNTGWQYLKWLTVFILTVWQVGCWRALDQFGGAFGNSPVMGAYEITFAVLVVAWFIYSVRAFLGRKKR